MKAVVLVGGEGTRLRPLTDSRPKQLLPVVEVPMLERVVTSLAAGGVDEVVLSLGYRPDDFLAVYGSGQVAGIPCTCVVESELLDTAGAIRFAAVSAGVDDTFVAVNGDVLSDIDVGQLLELHRRQGAAATIATVGVADPSRFGVVVTDDMGRVSAFVEKPAPGTAPTNQINAGAYVMEPSVLARIEPGVRVSVERQTFPSLVADGLLFARSFDTYWLDTGTPEAYLQAHEDLLQGRRGLPPAPGARQLSDGLWALGEVVVEGEAGGGTLLGAGARVMGGATVRASCVGADVTVGEGAQVTGSILLAGAHVGAGAVVDRSVVGAGATIGARARVVDVTVVGDGAAVPDGATESGGRVRVPAPAPGQPAGRGA